MISRLVSVLSYLKNDLIDRSTIKQAANALRGIIIVSKSAMLTRLLSNNLVLVCHVFIDPLVEERDGVFLDVK